MTERHRFRAAVAVSANALGAVTLTVWDTHSSVVHEGVRGEDKLDLPVTVSSLEEINVEVSVLVNVLFSDKDTACVTHIS